jgi:feruloyl esterase
MKFKLLSSASALFAIAGLASAPAAQPAAGQAGAAPALPCEQLAQSAFPDAKVTLAEARPAGPFTAPGPNLGPGPAGMNLPAFCRVAATLTPSADSDIRIELWLPANWNGKFMMVGNGGWSGSISYSAMAEPLSRGYAVASTDTGHAGARGTFAIGHPEKLIDFAWRAVHETAVKAKALTAAYYAGKPKLSYWNGCSSGGKQGLKEVQKFPADFDGVIAGAPANNWIRLQAQSLTANMANLPPGRPPILGPAQFSLLHKAAVEQCDGLDGLKDGEITDPRACRFKAASIVCKPGEAAGACLTAEQAEVADRIYAPVRDPKTKALIYPGMPPGSEMQWAPIMSQPWTTGVDTFAVLLGNPAWDFRSFDPGKEVAAAEKADIGLMAVDPDLSAFKARGGKLIQYHGWSDAFIPTENSVNYYESVVSRQGGLSQTQAFDRLFLVPGMGHCGGAYAIDWISALEQWVEGGHAPDSLSGRRLPPSQGFGPPPTPAPDLGARPICAYPQVASYKGAGSEKDPAAFACKAGSRGARPDHRP